MSYANKLKEQRFAFIEKADAIVAKAIEEKRDLTADEDKEVVQALADANTLDESIKHHEELEARSAEAARAREERGMKEVSSPAIVKSEARTYTERSGHSFIADAFRSQFNNDWEAQQRIARHMQEEKVERRDVTSANFAGLIVPQFLTELAAPFARAGRPYADRARKHQLPPDGLTLSISKVTTGTAVAEQTEGAAVQETNMDDTKLDISVITIAGQQNVSRQAIERGTNVDSLVMADLISAYHTKLDSNFVAEGISSAGQSVTYTDASPTVAELYPKLLDAIQKIQTNFFAGPNFILMHPRRLAFILAALDSSNRPLATPTFGGNQQMNAIAAATGSLEYGNSGYAIVGLPVITDANVTTTNGAGTNEDVILIGSTQEAHLWEEGTGQPMFLRFEQPKASELDVQMIVYGYSAYTHNRYPNAFAKITGTGLVTPTF
jgi:HK97 family phage major capsid protein